jgi:hypothetical protein
MNDGRAGSKRGRRQGAREGGDGGGWRDGEAAGVRGGEKLWSHRHFVGISGSVDVFPVSRLPPRYRLNVVRGDRREVGGRERREW